MLSKFIYYYKLKIFLIKGNLNELTAGIIIIGDEILSGRTKDLNGNWIAQELNEIGIRVIEIKMILDDKQTIIETVNDYRKKFSYIFTWGNRSYS